MSYHFLQPLLNQHWKRTHDSITSDILCTLCNAIAPFKTKMLHCDKCDYYICGSCMINYPQNNHSLNCRGQLTYVNHYERLDMNCHQAQNIQSETEKSDLDLAQSLERTISRSHQCFKNDLVADLMSRVSQLLAKR